MQLATFEEFRGDVQ